MYVIFVDFQSETTSYEHWPEQYLLLAGVHSSCALQIHKDYIHAVDIHVLSQNSFSGVDKSIKGLVLLRPSPVGLSILKTHAFHVLPLRRSRTICSVSVNLTPLLTMKLARVFKMCFRCRNNFLPWGHILNISTRSNSASVQRPRLVYVVWHSRDGWSGHGPPAPLGPPPFLHVHVYTCNIMLLVRSIHSIPVYRLEFNHIQVAGLLTLPLCRKSEVMRS